MSQNGRNIGNIKSNFKERGILKATALRPEIALSWERSKLQERVVMNITEDMASPEKWIINGEFKRVFISISNSLKEDTIFFVDRTGNIIDRYIRHNDIKAPKSFIEGFSGTTAFSVVAKIGKPYVVYYEEHYKEDYESFVSFCMKLPEIKGGKYEKDIYIILFSKNEIDPISKMESIKRIMHNTDEKENNEIEESSHATGTKDIKKEKTSIALKECELEIMRKNKLFLVGISREINKLKSNLNEAMKNQKYFRLEGDTRSSCIGCIMASHIGSGFDMAKVVIIDEYNINLLGDAADELDGFTIIIDSLNKLKTRSQIIISNYIGMQMRKMQSVRLVSIFYDKLSDDAIKETVIESLHSLVLSSPKYTYVTLSRRKEDMTFIVNEILKTIENNSEKSFPKTLSVTTEYIKGLENYGWPGGMDEIFRVIEFAIERSGFDGKLDANMIPKYIKNNLKAIDLVSQGDNAESILSGHMVKSLNLKDIEIEVINKAIAKNEGNMTKVASDLGIGRTTLYRKLKEYSIKIDVSK